MKFLKYKSCATLIASVTNILIAFVKCERIRFYCKKIHTRNSIGLTSALNKSMYKIEYAGLWCSRFVCAGDVDQAMKKGC